MVLCGCNLLRTVSDEDLPTAPIQEYVQETVATSSTAAAEDVRTQCAPINMDDPTTSTPYAGYGIRFLVPYNPKWGTIDEVASPYEEHPGSGGEEWIGFVSFGTPTGLMEVPEWMCGFGRIGSMTVIPARTEAQANKAFRDDPNPVAPIPKRRHIGDVDVLQYNEGTFCSSPVLEVLGKTYNYRFAVSCAEEDGADFKELEEVVKTIQLL